jgi:hypothetical protein
MYKQARVEKTHSVRSLTANVCLYLTSAAIFSNIAERSCEHRYSFMRLRLQSQLVPLELPDWMCLCQHPTLQPHATDRVHITFTLEPIFAIQRGTVH